MISCAAHMSLNCVFRPESFGARRDGIADDAPAINAAITAAAAVGGGIVQMGSGSYGIASSLILPSTVTIEGCGRNVTRVQVLDNFNGYAAIHTPDFANQSGTNIWLVDDGINHTFGLKNFSLFGDLPSNETFLMQADYPAQTLGGVWLYGKSYEVSDLHIHEFSGRAFVSEAGKDNGQDVPEDMPEHAVDDLFISACTPNDVQFTWLGPHDGTIGNLFMRHGRFEDRTGSWAILVDGGTNTGGFCHHYGIIHAYGHENGIKISSGNCQFAQVISESMEKTALDIEAWNATIEQLEVYNCGDGQGAPVVITQNSTRNARIGHAKIRGSLDGNTPAGAVNGHTIFYMGGVNHNIDLTMWLASDDANALAVDYNASHSILNLITDDQPRPIRFRSGIKNNCVRVINTGAITQHAQFTWNGSEFGNEISIKSMSDSAIGTSLAGLNAPTFGQDNSVKAWLSDSSGATAVLNS